MFNVNVMLIYVGSYYAAGEIVSLTIFNHFKQITPLIYFSSRLLTRNKRNDFKTWCWQWPSMVTNLLSECCAH